MNDIFDRGDSSNGEREMGNGKLTASLQLSEGVQAQVKERRGGRERGWSAVPDSPAVFFIHRSRGPRFYGCIAPPDCT